MMKAKLFHCDLAKAKSLCERATDASAGHTCLPGVN